MEIHKTRGKGTHRRRGGRFQLFPWVWLAVGYCAVFAILILFGRPYVESDMSAEMILADMLNQEGGLLSQNWWYSTEIRVAYVQPFFQLGLLIFPHDWYAARMLGQMLMVLVMIALCLYIGHGLKLKGNGVWTAAALVTPFGVWYLWYYLFAGAYLGHMIWLLLSFGVILHLLEPQTWRQWLWKGALLAGACLVSGLNSIKGIMALYLPLLVAALVLCVMRWYQAPQDLPRRELRLAGLSFAALMLAGVGYGINSTVLAATHEFKNYNNIQWLNLDLKELLMSWSKLLCLFGYPRDITLDQHIPVFSVPGLLGAFGVLTAGALVFSLFRLLSRWQELDERQRLVPVLFACMCVVMGAILVCAGGDPMGAPYYWLPAVPFAFLTLQVECETERFPQKWMRKAAAVALCGCLVATSIGSLTQFFSDEYRTKMFRTDPHLITVCDWLVDNGYTQGYATFWNGNVLTEWSSGEIEVWVLLDYHVLDPEVQTYEWLQKTSHATPPEGEIFLLTSREELEGWNLSDLYWWSNVVYEEPVEETPPETEEDEEVLNPDKIENHYLVMTYDSIDDLKAAITGAMSWAEEGAQPH